MVLDNKEVLILDEPARNISSLSIKSYINTMKILMGLLLLFLKIENLFMKLLTKFIY